MFERFNEKQKSFISDVKRGKLARINILEGSARNGKTYVNLVGWLMLVSTYLKDSNFLMVGKTMTFLKRNYLVLLESLVGKKHFTFSIPKK